MIKKDAIVLPYKVEIAHNQVHCLIKDDTKCRHYQKIPSCLVQGFFPMVETQRIVRNPSGGGKRLLA